MKKNIVIAATAAGLAYFIARRKKNPKSNTVGTLGNKLTHHATDIFARAKEQAVK